MRAQLDEESLKRIADITRAQYYKAGSAEDLQAVYKLLSKSIIVETKETEITAFFAAAAALLRAGVGGAFGILVQPDSVNPHRPTKAEPADPVRDNIYRPASRQRRRTRRRCCGSGR